MIQTLNPMRLPHDVKVVSVWDCVDGVTPLLEVIVTTRTRECPTVQRDHCRDTRNTGQRHFHHLTGAHAAAELLPHLGDSLRLWYIDPIMRHLKRGTIVRTKSVLLLCCQYE
jgi:hypothetical protein